MTRIVGALFAAPYQLFFVVIWVVASLVKPVLLMTCVCLLVKPAAAWRKCQLFLSTVQYLVLCNDKTWKTPAADPASFFDIKKDDDSNSKITRKTVIFLRHGESTWNDTFNKGDRSAVNFVLNFLPNLLSAAIAEYYFWVSGQANESWFYDSPLSDKGKRQAEGVKKFLQQDPAFLTPREATLVKILRGGDVAGDSPTCSSLLLSSNLRRAIATMAIGFQDRFDAAYEKDKMLILPALQEISRNPDALSITPPHGAVVPAWTDPVALRPIYEKQVDTTMHTGNKPVNTNGLKRLQEFCRIIFTEVDKANVIATGHSLWFRSFFRTYLPRNNTHIAKKAKLVNGGVVGFTLLRIETTTDQFEYMIDPTSIVVLHGGF